MFDEDPWELREKSKGMAKSKEPIMKTSVRNSGEAMLESIRIKSELFRDS